MSFLDLINNPQPLTREREKMTKQTTTRVSVTTYPNGGVKVTYEWPGYRQDADDDCDCCADYVAGGTLEAVYVNEKAAAKDVADFLTSSGAWAE